MNEFHGYIKYLACKRLFQDVLRIAPYKIRRDMFYVRKYQATNSIGIYSNDSGIYLYSR